MMRNNIALLVILTTFFIGCKEPLKYKYQDRPQFVDCPGADMALMHEALYSFQEDISAYYNKHTDFREGTTNYYVEAYKQFVYFGFSGEAKFDEIVSKHSLKLLRELKKIDGLWNEGNVKTNLNYSHELVQCLFKNIEDEDMKERLISLYKVDYLSPDMIADPMRREVLKIVGDEHLAMYMMLDAYYQYLINYDFPEAK